MKNTTIRKIYVSAMISTVLLLSVMAKADDPPSTKIILSPETTRISEPLNNDGTVNYLAALNKQYSKGVTAENNAAILLLQAAGPERLAPIIKDKGLAILGMPSLPSEGDYFVGFDTYVGDSEEAYEFLEEAIEGSWSARDYPKLADWLKANEKPLLLVIAAANRPRYYMPMLSPDEPPQIFSVIVAGLQIKREMARALVVRAMLKLDSGDIDGAQADLLAVHRLARLVGQGPTLIERLVGMAVESAACEGDNGLATSGRLTANQAQAYLSQLQGLPALPGIAETIDKCERFGLLDATMSVYRTGYKKWFMALFDISPELIPLMRAEFLAKMDKERVAQMPEMPVDWNKILWRINSWQDRAVDAARRPRFAEKMEAFDEISSEQQEMEKGADFMELLVAEEYTNTTEMLGSMIITIFCPDFSRAAAMYDVTTMKSRASQVAMALAGYRAQVGSYPESLAKLCPKYFKTVPVDLFTGKAVDYRRVKNGYVIYSAGAYDEDYDDIVVETAGSVNK
ncbi:MAG: hypothetical protein KAT11_03185 [Phycisphaerae bacterium]|nr:hypothetical protein [Phycisphaerae bacterium]